MMFQKSSIFALVATIAMTMKNCRAELLRTSSRFLAKELIAGYAPTTTVTDHNALDLDQRAMETQLKNFSATGFVNAQRIYSSGGNSNSYAKLTLASPLSAAVPIGTAITGTDTGGDVVTGEAYEQASAGATTLLFRYNVSAVQATFTECHVGGLVVTTTDGCLSSSGSLKVGSTSGIQYTYAVATDNLNGRTLKGFSTSANTKMRRDENVANQFYPDFKKFFDYYGTVDYADKIITAAFAKTSVGLNGKTFDFTAYDFDPRAEVVAKTSAYMSVAMYALRELEDSIDDCLSTDTKRNADSIMDVDQGVAFFTGSLEGTNGNGTGVLIHNLAERRCINFKTCGADGNQTSGNAKINMNIFSRFSSMQTNIAKKNCTAARLDKEAIAKQLFVPMIQGAVRYAYITSVSNTSARAEAEGAIFSASVLPIVAACDSSAAATIFNEMKPNSGNSANFALVKQAFERTYPCMGITCADVGGLYDGANAKYFNGAEPCITAATAAPATAPVKAPAAAPATSPVAAPATSPATGPTTAPATGPTEPCGLFGLSLFCPFSGCGLLKRIFKLGGC